MTILLAIVSSWLLVLLGAGIERWTRPDADRQTKAFVVHEIIHCTKTYIDALGRGEIFLARLSFYRLEYLCTKVTEDVLRKIRLQMSIGQSDFNHD